MEEMLKTFNRLMEGFKDKDLTESTIIENPKGKLSSSIGFCYYRLIEKEGKKLLGAFGISRFTNERFYEIDELGNIVYEWYCIECYVVGDSESESMMVENNRRGYERAESFGIPVG